MDAPTYKDPKSGYDVVALSNCYCCASTLEEIATDVQDSTQIEATKPYPARHAHLGNNIASFLTETIALKCSELEKLKYCNVL